MSWDWMSCGCRWLSMTLMWVCECKPFKPWVMKWQWATHSFSMYMENVFFVFIKPKDLHSNLNVFILLMSQDYEHGWKTKGIQTDTILQPMNLLEGKNSQAVFFALHSTLGIFTLDAFCLLQSFTSCLRCYQIELIKKKSNKKSWFTAYKFYLHHFHRQTTAKSYFITRLRNFSYFNALFDDNIH